MLQTEMSRQDLGICGMAVWSLAPGLLQPVFQAGRLRRNLEATQARFDGALAGYRKAALNGYREVANALVTIHLRLTEAGPIEIAAASMNETELAAIREARLKP